MEPSEDSKHVGRQKSERQNPETKAVHQKTEASCKKQEGERPERPVVEEEEERPAAEADAADADAAPVASSSSSPSLVTAL